MIGGLPLGFICLGEAFFLGVDFLVGLAVYFFCVLRELLELKEELDLFAVERGLLVCLLVLAVLRDELFLLVLRVEAVRFLVLAFVLEVFAFLDAVRL